MVWVYNSPFTSREQKVYDVLKRKLKAQDIAKNTVKLMSLYAFLKSSNFSSPKQIRDSTFLDSAKKQPVFTEEQAKSVFKSLKKKGGASKYPFTDHVAKQGVDYATTFVPESVKSVVNYVYQLATSPVRLVKERVPLGDLLIGALHSATETGVTIAGDVAEGIGGPVGAAFIAPLTALAAGIASLISLGEQDLGQGFAHLANAIPIMGSALGKGLTQMEHQVENLKKHPEVAGYLPFVSEYVTGQPRKSFSIENIQQDVKARGMAELQKRGIPTSVEEAQAKAQARLVEEAKKRGVPTSTAELQEQAKARGIAELQKRGVPTSTAELQSRATKELQARLPAIPTAAPAAGGKRFSTQRRKYSKWPMTRRNKSAKV